MKDLIQEVTEDIEHSVITGDKARVLLMEKLKRELIRIDELEKLLREFL